MKSITVTELAERSGVPLIDVREVDEFAAGHVPGAVNIPMSVIGNRLEMKDGIATGKLLKPVVAGPEKARLIREHAGSKGYDLGDCFAFSDSYSDVPMLSVVGHPAAVNPDKRLSWLAKAYGWPSFDLSRAA
jgi:phosphoserine phosphatase